MNINKKRRIEKEAISSNVFHIVFNNYCNYFHVLANLNILSILKVLKAVTALALVSTRNILVNTRSAKDVSTIKQSKVLKESLKY